MESPLGLGRSGIVSHKYPFGGLAKKTPLLSPETLVQGAAIKKVVNDKRPLFQNKLQDRPMEIHHSYCNVTYGGDKSICWLSENYIWGFAGPLACVIIFNLYILFTGLRVANKVIYGV